MKSEYKLTLKPEHIELILATLKKQPYEISANLIHHLLTQIQIENSKGESMSPKQGESVFPDINTSSL